MRFQYVRNEVIREIIEVDGTIVDVIERKQETLEDVADHLDYGGNGLNSLIQPRTLGTEKNNKSASKC